MILPLCIQFIRLLLAKVDATFLVILVCLHRNTQHTTLPDPVEIFFFLFARVVTI
jgi:hypothetical protein